MPGKKEISTYALFGMTNFRIGKLLFLETILIGTVNAYLLVSAAGIFLLKAYGDVFDRSLSDRISSATYSFAMDPRAVFAIYATSLLFLVIFCFMGLSALRVIYKFELVDLFKADKISEGKYKGSIPVLILSLVLIAAGYCLALSGDPMIVALGAIPILVLVITGTYLFFWGGLPKILGVIKRNKRVYYKGENLISTSAVSHRMKSIASVMATIAVLSAVAATAIATGFTLYSNAEKNTYSNTGFDLVYYGGDASLQGEVNEVFQTNEIKISREDQVALYEAAPETQTIVVGSRTHLENGDPFRVYSEAGYNKLISDSKTNLAPVKVPSGEACYIFPISQDGVESAMLGLKLGFGDRDVRIVKVIRSLVPGFGLDHTVVLSDKDYEAFAQKGLIVSSAKMGRAGEATAVTYPDALGNRALNEALSSVLTGKAEKFRTAYNLYNESMQIFGLICFIGFFMSGVFILMTGESALL